MTAYVYTGPDERIYTAYLAVAPDGAVSTLLGVPGGPPVEVMRAAGNDAHPEVPGDGLWVPEAAEQTMPAEPAQAASPADKPSKTSKAVAS